MKREINTLINLLDDENRQSASLVMAELLKHDSEIGDILMRLQESENPRLRRRVHQIQSILQARARRSNLSKFLKETGTGLLQPLINIHLLWYDNDSLLSVLKIWTELMGKSTKYPPASLENLAHFMKKMGFSASPKDDIEADYFCIGIVMDELTGADFMLCALAMEIASKWNLNLEVVQLMDNFGIRDEKGRILLPGNGWRLITDIESGTSLKTWASTDIIKLAASMLFMCAVSTDSFRYTFTLGQAIAKAAGRETLEFLPYPYNC
jgi:hypothetical protein